jgi:hypothetical protein
MVLCWLVFRYPACISVRTQIDFVVAVVVVVVVLSPRE